MIYFLVIIILWTTPAFYYPVECKPCSSTAEQDEKQIDHGNLVAKDISTLYLDNRFPDVYLVVDEVRLPAHRAVLASRSEYLRSLLFSGLQESGKLELEITDAPLATFKIILYYIYTGRMNLSDIKDKVIVDLYSLSNLYSLKNLQYKLSRYLRSNFNVHNVCSLFVVSRLIQPRFFVVETPENLLNFIETHALDVLQSKDFLNLSAGALYDIIIRDSFYANELDIFRAVYRWILENQPYIDSDVINNVLSAIRLPLMNDEELNEVSKSNLVGSEKISAAKMLRNTVSPPELQFRGLQNVNLIHGSQGVLDINEIDGGAMINLGHLTIINNMKIIFGDKDSGNYSYYIDVSIDGRHWVRVVDYSEYICSSAQYLWIPIQIVWFIRIVGTKNTVNKKFQLLELLYNTERWDAVKIENGIVAPKYNVAIKSMDATVIEGTPNESRHQMLKPYYGDCIRYQNYTGHRLGSGCIRVQLAQPYILRSMRMLLWDNDDLFYSYTVEVSVNNQDWVMIINNSEEQTHGWQVLHLKPRPIVFIRITGVRNSRGSIFRCVYFEAPAQVPLDSTNFDDGRDVTHYWENNERDITMTDASRH